MSSLDDLPLLVQASIGTNQEYYDDKLKKVLDTVASIIAKLIEKLNHIIHQIRIPSQYNDAEDDGLSDIYLPKVNSQNIFVSSYLDPDLDPVQGIDQVQV